MRAGHVRVAVTVARVDPQLPSRNFTMLLTEHQPDSGTPQADLLDRIRLRIRDQAGEQLVDLPSGKTTIGSSPRCNVRIQQPGVHPLHCLIVHAADGLTVRRWAVDTMLNGEPFDDARLAAGDHLSLGPVDLEIVGECLHEMIADRGDELCDDDSEEGFEEADDATIDESFDEPVAADEPVTENHSVTWGQGTVHHTTVWLAEEEEESSAPAEQVEAELEQQDEPAVAPPAEVIAADGAREVFRRLQMANALSRARSRRLLNALRTSRDAYRTLSDRVNELEAQIQATLANRANSQSVEREDGQRPEGPTVAWEDATAAWDEPERARVTEEQARVSADWHVEEVDRLAAQVHELTEAKAELAAENDALAHELSLLRQQLATAQQRYTEWDHQANEWEKQQAEWASERAEWEVIRSEWDVHRAEWDRERADWTRQLAEWKSRLTEHVRRIEELEAQLAEARAMEAESTRRAAQPFHAEPKTPELVHGEPEDATWSGWQASQPEPIVPPVAAHDWALQESKVSAPTEASPAAFDWADKNSAAPVPAESEADRTPFEGPAQRDAATSATSETDDDAAQFAAFSIWNQGAAKHTPAWEAAAETAEAETPAWERESPAGPVSPENNSASADHSTGDHSTAEPSDSAATAAVAQPIETGAPVAGEEPPATEKRQPTSYIERFAPMFAEEEASGHAPPPATPQPPAVDKGVGKPRNTRVIRPDGSSPPAANADDDESIEQYMAKLMQRLRGDKPFVPASQVAPVPAVPQPNVTGGPQPPTPAAPAAAPRPAAPPATVAVTAAQQLADQSAPDLSELVRKAPVIGRATNHEALRALANETARRAIGVHATKKHRREAVTKFTVASMAGMTSMWLMLLAPDWRDLQFISACVALLIAAYWAGQTYGTLLELARAGDYDGPQLDFDDDLDDLNPPLPIDVERGRR